MTMQSETIHRRPTKMGGSGMTVKTVNKINSIIMTDSAVLHQRDDALVYEIFGQGNQLYVFCNINGNVEPVPHYVVMA